MTQEQHPITGYRLIFSDSTKLPEDFPDVDSAWTRRCEYLKQTGDAPYVHPLREGGSPFPFPEG